jgi:hypothetical protein
MPAMTFNNGYGVDPATRNKVAHAAVEAMLDRASRIVMYREAEGGTQQVVVPADTFRMNLMAILAALDGEHRAERLAIDDEGAGAIAQILREAEGTATLSLPREWIDTARQLYETAALAGRDVADGQYGATIPANQYHAVERAAMMLGQLLTKIHHEIPGSADGE